MLESIIKSMLPPGVSLEQLTNTAQNVATALQDAAQQIIAIRQEQERQAAMLRSILAFCQAGATAQAPNEQRYLGETTHVTTVDKNAETCVTDERRAGTDRPFCIPAAGGALCAYPNCDCRN